MLVRGAVAPIVTPFHDDGGLDLDRVPAVADFLLAHVTAVLDATELPTVLYDYPARTGVPFDAALDRLAADPRVIGIKEASGDLDRARWVVERYGADLPLVCGSDAAAADYLALGASPWIAGLANALPERHAAAVAAAARGDITDARAHVQRMRPVLADAEQGRYTQKVRHLLSLRGVSVGPPRLPLQRVVAGSDEDERVRRLLAAALGAAS